MYKIVLEPADNGIIKKVIENKTVIKTTVYEFKSLTAVGDEISSATESDAILLTDFIQDLLDELNVPTEAIDSLGSLSEIEETAE